jgi:hypothetical protein
MTSPVFFVFPQTNSEAVLEANADSLLVRNRGHSALDAGIDARSFDHASHWRHRLTTSDISARDLSCGGPRDPLFDAFEKVTGRLRFTADVHRAIKPHVCLTLPKTDGRIAIRLCLIA